MFESIQQFASVVESIPRVLGTVAVVGLAVVVVGAVGRALFVRLTMR